jgi:hypothetical protein
MATLIKRLLPFLMGLGLVSGCQAGWLNPSQQGFVIQTFTSYQPISGNNSGTIVTNGNSYQVAGDNTGAIYIGGPGSQFRGKNDGSVFVDGDGAFVLGSFGSLATVTNRGKGSLVLGNLSVGQKAVITDVGNAAILIGAGTVSNSQSIVVGDGNASHGNKSVTAGSFWGMGSGFFGNGSGLTNLPTDLSRFAVADATVLSGRVTDIEAKEYLPTSNGCFVISDPAPAGLWDMTGMTYTSGSLARDAQTGSAYATGMAAVVVGRTYVVRFRLFQTLTTFSSVFFGGHQWDFSGGHAGDSFEFPVTAVDTNVFGCSYGTTVAGQFGLDTLSVYLVPRATTTGEIEADSGVLFGGGTLKVVGNQLVFVVGAVTNVLDANITQP